MFVSMCLTGYWSDGFTVQKAAELIEMPFGGSAVVGPSNRVLDGIKIGVGRIHLQPQGVTSWCAVFCHITLDIVIINTALLVVMLSIKNSEGAVHFATS